MPLKPHGRAYQSVLDLVGGTPLVRLERSIPPEHAAVLAKCELFNPGGSVKDRLACAILESAERLCQADKECTIIEATSGNTGISLALACAAKGYRLILVMPESMSIDRRRLLKHLGAELVLTPPAQGMQGAIAEARRLQGQIDRSFIPGQFSNPAGVEVHRKTTAEEIWLDTDGAVDIIVAGVGTGATLTGVAEALKARKPEVKAIAVEPAALPAIRCRLEKKPMEPGSHKIQGIGAGFIPEILNLSIIDEVIGVEDEEAFRWCRKLAQEEGIPGGISSGASLVAAAAVAARPENRGKTIVTFICSAAERYLSTPLFEDPLTADREETL